MRTGVSNFQSKRLEQARESLGITKAALANIVGVSPATVTNWENGSQTPEQEKLTKLSEAVNLPPSWFLIPPARLGNKPYFYRSLSSSTKVARGMAKVRLDWVMELSEKLEQWVDWPEVNLPSVSEEKFLTITDEEIEALALECRNRWGLGLSPINDVVLALENAGVIFARDEIGYLKMDGVSNWNQSYKRPFVFVTADKANGIRNRFDASHELAHLVLHQNVSEENFKKHYKEVERQADYFAGCFLLPSESFSSEVNWPTLDTLLSLKPRWKVSVAAMIMRCCQLGILDHDDKSRLFKGRSARGWTKGEPYDDTYPLEQPRLLNRAIKMIVDQGVCNKQDLAFELGLSENRIELLSGLPKGYFASGANDGVLVQLKSKLEKSEGTKEPSQEAKILSFPKSTS